MSKTNTAQNLFDTLMSEEVDDFIDNHRDLEEEDYFELNEDLEDEFEFDEDLEEDVDYNDDDLDDLY